MKKLIALAVIVIAVAVLLVMGKKSISTDIVINAPAEKAWSVLVDFEHYPDWNPFLRKLSGTTEEGGTIEVTFKIRGSDPVVFTPEITRIEQNKLFQWEGKLFVPGIFTGKHSFILNKMDNNKTELVQKEEFNGILVPFFNFGTTVEGFKAMNTAFKERVEGI